MIDIHAHILPDVDDGPSTVTESLIIIQQAIKEGVTDIIATSHAYSPHFHVSSQVVNEKIALLQTEMAEQNLEINIHAGQELRIQDNTVEMLLNGEALTLANSKYVLLELPSSGVPVFTVPIIQSILNQKMIPIIAHPERNRGIAEKPSRLLHLINNGALAQITAGSLSGHFGKSIQRLSLQLVDANLVHTYGSDVHNAKTRPLLYDAGLSYLEKNKRLDVVDILLENNARILENKGAIILEPQEVKKSRWWSKFS